MKLRYIVAWPFRIGGLMVLFLAYLLSPEGWDDTFTEWLDRWVL